MKHIIYYFLLVFAISATTVTAEGKKPDLSGKDEYGREYVDMGFGVLWATCNVGASNPWEYGLYFAWGETKGYDRDVKHNFDWKDYGLCFGTNDSMIKYCTDPSYGIVDNKTVLEGEDDAATANWGPGWRMPTREELELLAACCKWKWKTNYKGSGVNGFEATSKVNGNKLFLPATSYRFQTDKANQYEFKTPDGYLTLWRGYYWSTSLSTKYNTGAFVLECGHNQTTGAKLDDMGRMFGISVRAVRAESK